MERRDRIFSSKFKEGLQGAGILALDQVRTQAKLSYSDTYAGKYTATRTKDSVLFLHNATHSCIVIDQMRITNCICRFHIETTPASSVLVRLELNYTIRHSRRNYFQQKLPLASPEFRVHNEIMGQIFNRLSGS